MRNYILIHSIITLIPTLIVVYQYHFVIRGQSGLAFIYLTVIALFFLCILSGILGTKYSNSIWLPAVINCGVVLIAMMLTLQPGVMTLVPLVFILTFICSFFTGLIINGSSGTFLHKTYLILFALLLIGGIYTFLAFVNGPAHRGNSSMFFHTEETPTPCEPVSPTREQYEKYRQYAASSGVGEKIGQQLANIYSSTLLVDENRDPYSGKLYLYRPKLKINPLPRKKEVLLYYMDGFLWGYSYGQTHLPTYYTDNALLHLPGMPASLPYLIYHKYEQEAVAALTVAGEYYVMPDNRLLALGEDNRLYLGEVDFHYNGVMSYIFWKTLDMQDDLDWYHHESRYFDTLGYSDDRSAWKAGNFIPVDTLPNVLQPGVVKDPGRIKLLKESFAEPVRIWIPENSYQWKDGESLFFNLCGLHGFSEKSAYPVEMAIADRRDKSVQEIEPEEVKLIADLLNQCLIEPQLDQPGKKHIWYGDASVYFIIEENTTKRGFALGYVEARFIIKNSFYTFIFPEEKEKQLTEQLLRIIGKYIAP